MLKKLTDARRFQLKRDAEWAGFKVGFSDDGRFAWIVINEHGGCRFMKALEEYESWRMYETMFKVMVNAAKAEQAE